MFGYPAAFVNGNMAAGLHRDDLVLKLANKDRDALMTAGGAKEVDQPLDRVCIEPAAKKDGPTEVGLCDDGLPKDVERIPSS